MSTAKTKKAHKGKTKSVDPRFAALARLLARHAARRDFERLNPHRQLIETDREDYPASSTAGD